MIKIAWVWKNMAGSKLARTVHLQGDEVKTLCGRPYGPNWAYEVNQNDEAFNCIRCIRSWLKNRKSAKAILDLAPDEWEAPYKRNVIVADLLATAALQAAWPVIGAETAKREAFLRESAECDRLRSAVTKEQEEFIARIVALEDERDILAEKLRAAEAHGATCGLCGRLTPASEIDGLFRLCENCTDIGVSTLPKEVFELRRQSQTYRQRVTEVMGRLRAEMGSMVVNLPADYWIRKLDAALTELGAEEAGI